MVYVKNSNLGISYIKKKYLKKRSFFRMKSKEFELKGHCIPFKFIVPAQTVESTCFDTGND